MSASFVAGSRPWDPVEGDRAKPAVGVLKSAPYPVLVSRAAAVIVARRWPSGDLTPCAGVKPSHGLAPVTVATLGP